MDMPNPLTRGLVYHTKAVLHATKEVAESTMKHIAVGKLHNLKSNNVVRMEFLKLLYHVTVPNIGAFCLRMRENHPARLQMADLLGGCEFCHGFYEKYGLNFCSISQNSCEFYAGKGISFITV
jgi:hypothetical protein